MRGLGLGLGLELELGGELGDVAALRAPKSNPNPNPARAKEQP